MRIKSIRANRLSIPFKAAFKHASATRATTETLWVEIASSQGATGYGEGCPRQYVTAESLDSAENFIATHKVDWRENLHDITSIRNWANQHETDIDANPSAWTAVEIALLDVLGKEQNCSVESLLGLPELHGTFRYSAVVGDASAAAFETQVRTYRHAGFNDFKIKLSGDLVRDLEKTSLLKASGLSASTVRADANNFWRNPDEVIKHIEGLAFPFHAIEEPLQTGDMGGMLEIAAALKTNIIVDESLLRVKQLELLASAPQMWIVNLRVSKMGGVLRSLMLFEAARQMGVKVIVGAHVGETSVLTRAALTVASQARELLLAQEGAFGTHLLTADVVTAPLVFDRGGILDMDVTRPIQMSGFGLDVMAELPGLSRDDR